ncbi:MAG: efflux RND transporter permease subunit [Spirochaetales bacterium]|nr:efflux RND transporter permease subunit [Spirochaetales bacterium]
MKLTQMVVKRPATLLIVFVLLVALGIYTTLDIPIDLFPEINPPILVVYSNYEGAGPEEIEKTVTRLLESALSNVSNIEEMTSTSSEGTSMVILSFVWGTNMSEAANEVRDKLEFIKSFLPDEAETPQIFKFDPSIIPILNLIITGNRSPEELREIAEKIVQPRLEQVEGVAMTSIEGGREKIIRVEIPQNRLDAYNLNLTAIVAMLRGQNIQISAGSITEGNKNYLIRTAGEYKSIEEIKNTVVSYKTSMGGMIPSNTPARMILLRDIANVFEGYKKESSTVYVDGKPGVYVSIQKQSGTNSVRTADNVIGKLDSINRDTPSGVRVEVVQDTTKYIRNSLSQVGTAAIVGVILVVIILFVFLRSFKSTLIIAISVPVSIIITLMLMFFFNLTLNIMTLAGLALGIGMLVDNSIVILENIYRYREKGAKLTSSAILGSQEMINAIVASTLTTICVFLPIALFKSQLGLMGELFSGLAFTVVISLSSSLFVAIFLVPILASRYLPISSRVQRPLSGGIKAIDDVMESLFRGLENGYKKALGFVLNHKKITILIVFLIFIGSLFLIPISGFELMPVQNEDAVMLNVELPIGTKLEVTGEIMNQLEILIKEEIKGYKNIIVTAGQGGFMAMFGGGSTNQGRVVIILPSYKDRVETSKMIQEKLRTHFNDFPSVVFSFPQQQMGGSSNPIDVVIKSEDLDLAKLTATKIQELVKEKLPDITEPSISLKEGLPQLEVFIDRDKAYSLGLNIYSIGQELKACIDGVTASRFRQGGSEYDILVILDPRDRDAIPDLQKIFVLNSMGKKIPFSSFAHLERTTGPISITRENQTRVVHMRGGLRPGAKLNEVELQIRKLIAEEIPSDENMVIGFSGDFAELVEYFQKFIIIIIISIALVFGVMASQFESFLDPFIIFFTIPLILIGVIILYTVTGGVYSLFTAVGLVVLVGIVVNNGIVLVDYTNLLRKRGFHIREACIEAGGNRLRPILMTTLTTILGLIPMSFFQGEGAELVQPIGKTIVGGLTASTILTLFLIPVIYAIFNRFPEKRNQRLAQIRLARLRQQRELQKKEEG